MKRVKCVSSVFIKNLLIIFIFLFLVPNAFGVGPLIEFDDVAASTPATPNTSNSSYTYAERGLGTDEWTSTTQIGSSGYYMEFYRYLNTYNNDHLGWEAWGYSDIVSDFAISGNSFHTRITGGKSTEYPDGQGAAIYGKQDYLDYSGDPSSGTTIGVPYIYFSTTDGTLTQPFEGTTGADELSLYVHMPSSVIIDTGETYPNQTMSIGPYISGTSGHYYHRAFISGGGWVHFIVDNHPNHYNGYGSCNDFPVDGCAFNSFAAVDYIQKFSHMYIALEPGATPSDYYIDNLEFRALSGETDQNFETLNSPAVGFYDDGHFELSFYDKYRDERSGMTVEIRYSKSPITNENWSSATLVDIQEHSGGFTVTEVSPGQFRKANRYYRQVWAPFRLQSADEALLKPGDTIYFAFKDVGNLDGNGNPTQSCSHSGCRDYTSGNFDWAGDSAVLHKIRTIDYVLSNSVQVGNSIQPPGVLRIGE